MKQVLLEALLIALVGAAFAFAANALSPRGLTLTRNYFPPLAIVEGAATNQANPSGATNGPADLAARLQSEGFHLATSNDVVQLFHDPRYQQGLVLFIDAREDEPYQQGHIPGAYHLNYMQPGPDLAPTVQLCQNAQQVLLYCNGGNCELSELAAGLLANLGIARDKLWVSGGGIGEWETNGLPVEIGPRGSGQLRESKK